MDHHSLITRIAGAAVLAGALVFGPAVAQEEKSQSGAESSGGGQQAQGAPERKQLMQMRQKLQSLQRELGQLQQQALKENPELKKQQQDLQDLVVSTMQDNGHTPEKDMARMREIQGKLQSKDVKQGQKQQLVQEMRKRQRALAQGRQEAFKDKEVQKKSTEFRDNLLAAMKEVDPEAQSLLKEYQETRQKMQKKMMQMRSQQQGNS